MRRIEMMRVEMMIPGLKASGFRQRGAALFIGLVMLLLLTVIGLASSNVAIMQERMAGNMTDANMAFQQAEATVREIEQRLTDSGSGGLGVIEDWSGMGLDPHDCSMSDPTGWSWDTPPWETAPGSGNDYMIAEMTSHDSACRPISSVAENKGPTSGEYFLIVARGEGPSGKSEAIVQSVFFWPK